jgi:hypothetical protein
MQLTELEPGLDSSLHGTGQSRATPPHGIEVPHKQVGSLVGGHVRFLGFRRERGSQR